MNGMNGAGGPPGLWQEARNADGRVYYYNVQTKATQWTKPAELMTPAERALSNQPWKEYTAEGGRKYWYNTESKVSTWEMPEAYKQALASQPALPPKPAASYALPLDAQRLANNHSGPQFVAGGGSVPQRDDYQERVGPDRQIGWGAPESNGAPRGPAFQKASGPEYNTYEEAEAAFFKLLRRSNVQSDWTWEQAVRATVKDPQYQAVKDPRDRKAAFEKFVNDMKIQEKERAKDRLEKLRADFGKMLRSHQEIKHYTRWKTARPIIEREAIFRSTDDENERRQLFEEYIIELKKAHVEQEAVTRKSAMDELTTILKNLDLEPYTRWVEAREKVESHPRYAEDPKFQTLSKSDVLTAFENHIKSLERTFNDARQKDKQSKARKERKNRDGFIDLLKELRSDGKIKAGTKWKSVQPLVKDDPRFKAILGQPGSGPLDLFRDMLEEEERSLRLVRNEVYDVLEDRRYEVTPSTTFTEFEKVMQSDRRTANIPTEILTLLYERLQEKIARRAVEDAHASERHARRAIDALRSRIKRLDPPVRADSTWESVRSQISNLDEYKALETEEQRKQAFEKVVRRLREKEEDIERERAARGGRERRKGRGDFTPDRERGEPDAYEADRRKAMADRERQYRKGSGTGASGGSPSARDRERERERGPGAADRFVPRRDEGRLRDDHRERDRRERDRGDRDRRRSSRGDASYADEDDRERERLYRARGDPRGGRDELDYDGGLSSGGRRRRQDSEGAESMGSVRKRARREERASKERERDKDREKDEKKEEVAMHSGSEEGEMVED